MKKDLKNKRRGGFYWIQGKPFISVTNVLKILNKPAIVYWFGKEVYWALTKDPSLSEREALSAPYKTSGKAKDRGKTVHSIVEAYKGSKTEINTIPKAFKGYANAFYKWVKDNDVKILSREKTVISREHGFAGTLDLLVEINGEKKTLVVDVKTGKAIYGEVFLQLSAYKHAVEEEDKKVDGIAALLLKEDGNYIFEKGEDCFDAFLACKDIWEWDNKSLLEKMRG